MWQTYLNVVAKAASQALNILSTRSMSWLHNKAIDRIRAIVAKEVKAKGNGIIVLNPSSGMPKQCDAK